MNTSRELSLVKDKLIICEGVNKKKRKQIKKLVRSLEDVLGYALRMQGLGEDLKDFKFKTNRAKEVLRKSGSGRIWHV